MHGVSEFPESGTAQLQDMKDLQWKTFVATHDSLCHEYRVMHMCMSVYEYLHVYFDSLPSVPPTRQTTIDIITETIIYIFRALPYHCAGLWFNS